MKRIMISLIIVFGVLSLTFIIIHLAPGDPTSLYIRPEINPATVESIRRQLGLDKPLWQQYILWIREFMSLNFGFSFSHLRPVSHVLGEAILNTLQLTISVFGFQFFVGIILGIITAIKQKSKLDHGLHSVLIFLYSIPGFWLALMLILIFSLKLGWLPSSQMKSLYLSGGLWIQFIDRIKHLILPILVLSAPFIAYTARYVRAGLIDVFKQPYIRTAHAYGIKSNRIIFRYALKNVLLPLVTLIGFYLPFLLGGAVVTEYIFAWPGMGRITVNAIFAHDYPLVLAVNSIAALTVVIGNLISDILYTIVDPRIRIKSI